MIPPNGTQDASSAKLKVRLKYEKEIRIYAIKKLPKPMLRALFQPKY